MTVYVYHSDALSFLRKLPDDSIHAVITDPPYGLSNLGPGEIAKALEAWISGDRGLVPVGKGFMGREWDAFVPPPAVWDEAYRVLKPGGHMAVFAGSRTVDLMGLSIRLAGFEMRDGIAAWLYGSGFPKSLDVGKAIDKARDEDKAPRAALCAWLADRADEAGVTRRQVDEALGTSDMAGWWLSRLPHRCATPTVEQWEQLRALIGFDSSRDAEVARLNGRKGTPGEAWDRREVVGDSPWSNSAAHFVPGEDHTQRVNLKITAAAQESSREWQGWGTALKPAHEPILLARKPLSGTVAANVLAHRAGAINVDATRVPHGDDVDMGAVQRQSAAQGDWASYQRGIVGKEIATYKPGGRWPANVVFAHHPNCGPDEASCMPGCQVAALDEQSGPLHRQDPATRKGSRGTSMAFGDRTPGENYADPPGSSASRFFPTFRYQAKAPKSERPQVDGKGHSTVKPLGLIRWLYDLLVPPGGVVADFFAGSGPLGEVATERGGDAILVDSDAFAVSLIRERLATRVEHVS